MSDKEIRLTALTTAAGCAAKVSPEAMEQVLLPLKSYFNFDRYPELLVGLKTSDDAAVYKISSDIAVIQTIDFFTPIVDNPFDYGAIAASNAMSDVFAMGGEVALALNVCCFPSGFNRDIIAEILRGGAEKTIEAGAVIAGGHTVDDEEIKYGLSVMGLIHPDKVITKAGARPGDLLALTKPLGVGIITTALKGEVAEQKHVTAATQSMKRLNRGAAKLIQNIGVHACTDITGYALLGHAYEMADKSGERISINISSLPFLEGSLAYAEDWLFPKGTNRNMEYYKRNVEFESGVSDEMQSLLFTPETSGGLLVAFARDKLQTLTALFADKEEPIWVIGEVMEGKGIQVNP